MGEGCERGKDNGYCCGDPWKVKVFRELCQFLPLFLFIQKVSHQRFSVFLTFAVHLSGAVISFTIRFLKNLSWSTLRAPCLNRSTLTRSASPPCWAAGGYDNLREDHGSRNSEVMSPDPPIHPGYWDSWAEFLRCTNASEFHHVTRSYRIVRERW